MASFLSIYTKQTNLMIFFYFRIFKTIIQKKQTKKKTMYIQQPFSVRRVRLCVHGYVCY